MARFIRFHSLTEAQAAGYEPCTEVEADTYRMLGVPIYQRGGVHIAGSLSTYFAPRWAIEAVRDWPLTSLSEDFDHYLLKTVIRRVVRSGDTEYAIAINTVARLGGERAVREYLEASGDMAQAFWGTPKKD